MRARRPQKAAQELPKSDHPWYEEFKDYEHWGIVGGALAVNRADYQGPPRAAKRARHDLYLR
jgi:hypothetical protein